MTEQMSQLRARLEASSRLLHAMAMQPVSIDDIKRFNASARLPRLTRQRAALSTNALALRVMCLLIQDEAKHVREWINFHRAWGWNRFVVYDDGSRDDLQRVLGVFPLHEVDLINVTTWKVARNFFHKQCTFVLHARAHRMYR